MAAPFLFDRTAAQLAGSGLGWADPGRRFRLLALAEGHLVDPAQRVVSDLSGELRGGGYRRLDLVARSVVVSGGAADLRAASSVWDGLLNGQLATGLVVYEHALLDSEAALVGYLPTSVLMTGKVTVDWSGLAPEGPLFRVTTRGWCEA
jgi:hypothetical protein